MTIEVRGCAIRKTLRELAMKTTTNSLTVLLEEMMISCTIDTNEEC